MNSTYRRKLAPLLAIAATQFGLVSPSFAFEAHEWGTFTSLVGSSGVTQNGMYHEDEELPAFVHGFGDVQHTMQALTQDASEQVMALPASADARHRHHHVPAPDPDPAPQPDPDPDPEPNPIPTCHNFKGCFEPTVYRTNIITQKMETPVIYFYSDRPQHVDVNVKFPEGVVTETYPAPLRTSPTMNVGMSPNIELKNGDTQFAVDILTGSDAKLPTVDSSNIYSHARNVNSNVVQSGSENEKFIFYRGLGRFQPKLHITSSGNSVTLSGPQAALPQAAFLVHVDETGDGQMLAIGKMVANQPTVISEQQVLNLYDHDYYQHNGFLRGPSAHDALVKSLVIAGLKTDEARAMVDTWEHGYLKVPGLRLLYILPRSEVDATLPVSMSPTPDNFTRVFVGRIEILTDAAEKDILKNVLVQRYSFNVASLGRFAEPMLRRVSEVYTEHGGNSEMATSVFDTLIGQAASAGGGGTGASTAVH